MIRTGKHIAAMLDSRITSKLKVIVIEFVHHRSFYLATEHFFSAIAAILAGGQRKDRTERLAPDYKKICLQYLHRNGLGFIVLIFFQGLHVCTGTLFFFNCGPNISICSSFSKHSMRTSIIFENYKFPLQIACLTRSVY